MKNNNEGSTNRTNTMQRGNLEEMVNVVVETEMKELTKNLRKELCDNLENMNNVFSTLFQDLKNDIVKIAEKVEHTDTTIGDAQRNIQELKKGLAGNSDREKISINQNNNKTMMKDKNNEESKNIRNKSNQVKKNGMNSQSEINKQQTNENNINRRNENIRQETRVPIDQGNLVNRNNAERIDMPNNIGNTYKETSRKRRQPRRGKKRDPIIIIGSSMVGHVHKFVGMKEEGSYRKCLSGAGIGEIMNEAIKAAEKAPNGTKLFIQGGGNSLKHLGADETVRRIRDGVKVIRDINPTIWVIVLSLTPRPREKAWFEKLRLETNTKLWNELDNLAKKEDMALSIIDMDPEMMSKDLYGQDGVHFSYEGNRVFGQLIVETVKWACKNDSPTDENRRDH